MDEADALGTAAVIVPLDGSDLSETAVDAAKVIAEQLGVPVGGLMVVDDESKASGSNVTAYLDDAVDRFGLAWQVIEVNSDVAEGIHYAAVARNALICMATHGHGRAGAVFGQAATSSEGASR